MKSCAHPNVNAVVVYPDNELCPLCVANSRMDRVGRLEAELDLITHDLEVARRREAALK